MKDMGQRGQKWEHGRCVPGLVRETKGAYGEGRLSAVSSFPEHKRWRTSLTVPVFQDHGAWVNIHIISRQVTEQENRAYHGQKCENTKHI